MYKFFIQKSGQKIPTPPLKHFRYQARVGIAHKDHLTAIAKSGGDFHPLWMPPDPVNHPMSNTPMHLILRRRHPIARCLTRPHYLALRRETGDPDQFRQPVATSDTWWHPPIGPQNTAMDLFLLGDFSRDPAQTGKYEFGRDRPLELC